MDSCLIVNDETVLADQSTTGTDRSLHTASKPSVAGDTGKCIISDSASTRAVAENAGATETTVKSSSRFFDLVNAHSPPVAQVSQCGCVCVCGCYCM